MSTQPAISIKPVVSYPHQAQVGKTYLMTIDLESPENEWPYEEEEYPIYCMLETAPFFSYKTLGEPAIVLHRFGGSYGAAKFLLTAAQQEMQGEITVTLVNGWGVPIRVLNFDEISITQSEIPAQKTSETYEIEVDNPESDRFPQFYRRNPYIFGTFIDKPLRDSLFQAIEELLLEDTKFILLHGQRRMGKTTFLKNIPLKLTHQEQFYFVYYDLQEHFNSSLNQILYAIATNIFENLNLDSSRLNNLLDINSETIIFRNFQRNILSIYETIGHKNLVLLLDECNIVMKDVYIQLLQFLENLTKTEEELFVIAVVDTYLNYMPNFLQIFKGAPSLEIGLLSEEDATKLITQPAEGILKYDTEAVKEILKLSSGHPFYTESLCFALFNSTARARDNFRIVPEDVQKAIQLAIEISEGGLGGFWERLSVYEKVVIATIAEAQAHEHLENPLKLLEDYGLVVTNDFEQAISDLIHKGFLNHNPIKMKVELIRLWVVQRHRLRDGIRYLETVEEENIDLLLRAARDLWQRNRQSNSLDIYEEILRINPNHFSIIEELADKYLQVQNFDKALPLYERIYKLDPAGYQQEFIRVLNEYANWLTTQRNYIKAQEQYEKIFQIEPENTLVSEKLRERLDLNINPSKPPEPFVGRRSLINAAFDQIYNRRHFAVWGGLGMGKTYFLKHIASPQVWREHGFDPSSAVIVVFSCQEISPFTPSGFWAKILVQIKDNISNELALQTEIETFLSEGRTSKDTLRQVLTKLGQREKFLVLLLDDYDVALVQNPDYSEENMQQFLSECRNLAVHVDGRRNLSVIVTSKKRLNDLVPARKPNQSPWYNHYLFGALRAFDINETKEFLELSFNKPISPEFLTVIVEITGGNPALLDTASSLISRELQNSNLPNAQEFVINFESSTRHFFASIWCRCSEVEQTLLILIVLYNLRYRLHNNFRYELSGIDIIFTHHERQLSNLKEQGLISSRDSEIRNYYLTSSSMERWITQEISNTNDPARIEARKTALQNLMSFRQVEQVTTAIEWLQNHRDQVYSEMGWMENLVAPIQRFFETIR